MRFPVDVRNLTLITGSDPAGLMAIDSRHELAGRRSCSAHAYRADEIVCGRVELTVDVDAPLDLTARERRCVTVRFSDRLEPALRAELTELVRRRGAAARRAAERMKPIEIVFDDPSLGLQRITGSIQPPQRRSGELHDIKFVLRETAP
jgi:hypothetical protein